MRAPLYWHVLYRLLLAVAYPWVHIRLRLRSRREPDYAERIEERFGRLPNSLPVGPIWFHTVSAGETIAAAPFISRLSAEMPGTPFLVTTMTPTGSAQVTARLGDSVAHCYAPYDFESSVARFFDRIRPRLLVLMETELWPNMLAAAEQRDVPVLLVNARLSERSRRGYARVGALTHEMLNRISFIACQYSEHAERFLALGARPDRLGVLGSVKFDVELASDHVQRVEQLVEVWDLADRPVWVAGSTHAGEEQILLEAHRQVLTKLDGALLIIVPRHPYRSEEVCLIINQAGLRYRRMSEGGGMNPAELQVIVGDTMGELVYLYGLSSIAYLGGSLVSVGGHNPIEAAICGQPLLMGPETFNFPDVVSAFADAGCLTLVSSSEEIAARVIGCFSDVELQARQGAIARSVVDANTGATERLLNLLRTQIRATLTPGYAD